jgi:hypothetical protein
VAQRDRRSKASNYHSPASTKPPLSGNQSPGALVMKELEIRRMRELIAKREEETRLKKLASAKSSVNIDTSGSLTPCDHVPSLKQEDVDVVMNPNSGERNGFGNYRNSESATPPPRSVSKSSNGFSPSTVINPVSDGVLTLDEDSNRIANDPLNQDPTATHRYQDLASEAQEAQVNGRQVQEKEHATLGQGMVDADREPSPSTQVRLASSFYFLSYLGGDFYFICFPVFV